MPKQMCSFTRAGIALTLNQFTLEASAVRDNGFALECIYEGKSSYHFKITAL